MPFELIHKPTFTNQLLALPHQQVPQILKKIEILREAPGPHGNLKKKLEGYQGNVYRLRSGDYRVIYTYGDGWVTLLGVDDRKDVYRGERLVAEGPDVDVSSLPRVEQLLGEAPESGQQGTTKANADLLPVQLDKDLLTRLRVPELCFEALLACRTIDELVAANIPAQVRDRVFDSVYSPNFDRVLAQPSFRTGDTEDLLRFREGELLGFLLKLSPEQEKFVTWGVEAKGPTLVKGGPGTGKSTVAIYRVQTLLKALKRAGTSSPRILFTTYTNALVAFSRQLLESLLGEESKHVHVKTADQAALSLIHQSGQKLAFIRQKELRTLIRQALIEALASLEGTALQRQAKSQTLKKLSVDYLIEEIGSVIEGRGITTLEEYLAATRPGRKVALNRTQRAAVWHLRSHFNQLLSARKLTTWPQARNLALAALADTEAPPPYDAVVIDEAQDLDPNALRVLIGLCRSPGRLFVTADANQSIYGSGYRWSDVHADLQFKGRTGLLRTNHRTTREIGEAAQSYLSGSALDEEAADERGYIHNGPQPAIRAVETGQDEGELVARFCREAAREFRLGIEACAVLVPTEVAGEKLAGQLKYLGVDALFMSSQELDLAKPCVKVVTLKSAKGLEFPVVAIAGFLESGYPPLRKDAAELEEITERERRTLFVGMTRAMRALLVVVPTGGTSTLLTGFEPTLWNLGSESK